MTKNAERLLKKADRSQSYATGKFLAAPGAMFNDKQAEAIGEEFLAMEAEGITLTPSAIVERARDENSPLHNHIEWRDDIAAEKYRVDQARHIVSHLQIVFEDQSGKRTVPVKSYFSIHTETGGERAGKPQYISVTQVLSNVSMRDQLVVNAARELLALSQKYENLGLQEFSEVYEAIKRIAPDYAGK